MAAHPRQTAQRVQGFGAVDPAASVLDCKVASLTLLDPREGIGAADACPVVKLPLLVACGADRARFRNGSAGSVYFPMSA